MARHLPPYQAFARSILSFFNDRADIYRHVPLTIKTLQRRSPPPTSSAHLSLLPRNADSKFHQRGEKKGAASFDALGNHVMKNRLLRIRISQALPHCIVFSQAEWLARVCVRGRGGVGGQAETCMISRRTLLTFFNYSLVGNVNSLVLNRLWHKIQKKVDRFNIKEQKNPPRCCFSAIIGAVQEQKPDTISHNHPTWRLWRPIPVIIVPECF